MEVVETADPPGRSRSMARRIVRRLLHWLGMGVVLLVLMFGFLLWAVDTGPGHRFLAERIAQVAPSTGLRIRIGRIDGSIWSRIKLRDVRLSDPQGVFLEVPELAVNWRPTAWLANRLDIRNASTDFAVLHRLPKLRPSAKKSTQILPGFDIRIDHLSVNRLRVDPAVTGRLHLARILGDANIRDGRARIALSAASSARDILRLKLDAEPDRDTFDLDLKLSAPAKGVIGAMLGTQRAVTAQISGKGNWTQWNGRALAAVDEASIVDLALAANSGRYQLKGRLDPGTITSGKLQRLSAPSIAVDGSATLVKRRLDGVVSLRSAALVVNIAGVADLAESMFEGMAVDLALLQPAAMFPNMTGRDLRLHVNLNGPFETAAFDYVLTAPRVAFDNTGFEMVRATGKGVLSKAPVAVPFALSAQRVTGAGEVAGGILRNLKVAGVVKVTAKTLSGTDLQFSSDKLGGKLSLLIDMVTGRYQVDLGGSLARYLIPGLGIVDVKTELKLVPGAGGRGTFLEGRGQAWVRRFDNDFLRSLAGGLPAITTRLRRGPDGIIHFSDLRLTAPDIRLGGSGFRRNDGTFSFKGGGAQRQYGPLTLQLDGDISRPRIDMNLERPMDALGLAAVRVLLDPASNGFAWRASGGSHLGPFNGNGAIILRPQSPALINIMALDVSGTRATGGLRADPGGFTGKILTSGGGIDGSLMFNPIGTVQRIETHLLFNRAQLGGMAALRVGRGQFDGVLMLDPAGPGFDGSVRVRGLRRNSMRLGRLDASVSVKGGRGQIKSTVAGSRGRAFSIQTIADLVPGGVSLTGSGTIDRQPVRLESPAVITQTDDGWRLDRTRLSFAGGGATLAGKLGGSATEVEASVSKMPLSILDVVAPNLGFGGHMTGRVSYRVPRGGRLPVGDADLTVRGLTRSGLVLTSRPVDMAIKARLTDTMAAGRAVALSEGKVIGRAQVRVAPLTPEGTIIERLSRAPLFGQLRYDGPADTLWRLTGVEAIDLSGPLAVAADVTGVLRDPRIRGSLRTNGAHMESAITGTSIDQIKATGRFGGSVLVIDDFSGTTRGGGSVTGRGRFDLAAVNGFGMDLSLQANEAQLLNRDDIAATVTGPLTIRSTGSGGMITGDVKLVQGRFRLGQAAATAVPRLNVTELNRASDDDDDVPIKPWQLDIKADARNRLMVTGLGLDSEWRANLAIAGTVDNPAITGRADLIRGGYEFAGRRFDLERGSIRFLGQAPPDPVLDIAASASIQGLNASILVTGTGLHPEIRFSSVPALPEDELLSRLLFGTSITNLSAPEALQLAAAVASLQGGGGGGLNPINAVRRAAGLDRLRILPADTTTGQGTSIAAGKYLGRRTYVELITDGQGYSATRVEFQITRWLSLLSSISTIGRQSVNVRVSKDY